MLENISSETNFFKNLFLQCLQCSCEIKMTPCGFMESLSFDFENHSNNYCYYEIGTSVNIRMGFFRLEISKSNLGK